MPVKTSKRVLIVLALIAISLIVVVYNATNTREPIFQDRPLSHWLNVLNNYTSTPSAVLEAKAAIKVIGTNAIPYLLNEMDRSESNWILYVHNMIRQIVLGENAQADTVYRQISAINACSILGSNASHAVWHIKDCLNSSDSILRIHAINAFSQITNYPSVSVPALLAIINGSNGVERMFAIRAIRAYKENAQAAAPYLMQLLCDSSANAAFRIESASAMHAIDPKHDPEVVEVLVELLEQGTGSFDEAYRILRAIDGEMASSVLERITRKRIEETAMP